MKYVRLLIRRVIKLNKTKSIEYPLEYPSVEVTFERSIPDPLPQRSCVRESYQCSDCPLVSLDLRPLAWCIVHCFCPHCSMFSYWSIFNSILHSSLVPNTIARVASLTATKYAIQYNFRILQYRFVN